MKATYLKEGVWLITDGGGLIVEDKRLAKAVEIALCLKETLYASGASRPAT